MLLLAADCWVLFFLALLLVLGRQDVSAARVAGAWWHMGMLPQLLSTDYYASPLSTPESTCSGLKGLSRSQQRFCTLHQDHMSSVARGAGIAIKECQYQFRYGRWNCSTTDDSSVFGSVMKLGSREAAFINAVSSAGVAYSISRACREGRLKNCGCGASRRPRHLNNLWLWGGCSDDIAYGYKFAKGFIDARERERNYQRGSRRQERSLINIHNNEAGRRAVLKMSKIACKCHGVSGSCAMKTCWQQLPPFRDIGKRLLKRYSTATRVRVNELGKLQFAKRQTKTPNVEDLLYVDQSPDYCEPDEHYGIRGTKGRPCNKDSNDIDGCEIMCCGRGYNTETIVIEEKCRCKFYWCCEVKCDTCIRSHDVTTCA